MTYLRYFFVSAILTIAAAVGINFIVDPAHVYRDGIISPETYAEALVHSEHGLYSKEGMLDERLLAKAVASKSFNAECIVVGSSHVMQISSFRGSTLLQDSCQSILNLGVSGGGIEDHFTLTYLALLKRQNGHLNKIFLGVDPWIFAFEKNQAYSAYSDDYLLAKEKILNLKIGLDRRLINIDKRTMTKLKNLVNLEYTVRSVEYFVKYCLYGSPVITFAPRLDYETGGDDPIRLPDNSYVYSSSYISKSLATPVLFGGQTYQTKLPLNQSEAISAYRDFLIWIKGKGVEPVIIMTPYHENVWKAHESPNAIALRETEPIVLNLAHELGIKVIGSYDPQMSGCLSNEFYDFMHPTTKCLDKLQSR